MGAAKDLFSYSVTGKAVTDALLVSYDALDWTVGYCRKIREGMRREEIEGWLLCRGYMGVLGLDAEPIFQNLADGGQERNGDACLEFWNRSIRKAVFRLPDEGLEFLQPGETPPAGACIEQILFAPDPSLIPFDYVIEALRQAGKAEGVKFRDLLFQYNGKYIRSANALADVLLNRDLDTRHVSEALDRWRDRLIKRFGGDNRKGETNGADKGEGILPVESSAPPAMTGATEDPIPLDPYHDSEFHVPECLQGKMVYRAQLARFVKRDTRTLKRWDKAGVAPSGKRWLPGVKVSGNLAVYDVAGNWPAIQSMLRRERDSRPDRIIAHELGYLGVDACDWIGAGRDMEPQLTESA